MTTRAAHAGARAQSDGSGARVLLIDDEMEFAELYKRGLEINGHQVRVAADGIKGLRLCRSWSPDLVLLDMKLALMDGPALLRELRRSSDGKRIRVVALTNYTKSEVESADPDLLGDLPWLLKFETTPHDLVRWIRGHVVLEGASADRPAPIRSRRAPGGATLHPAAASRLTGLLYGGTYWAKRGRDLVRSLMEANRAR